MPLPILTSKLQMPALRHNLVQRPALMTHLNAGLHRKLTLISAPAGFGKTTVTSSWITQHKISAAWVSLHEHDRDPSRFLAHMIAAIQTFDDDIGRLAREALRTVQPLVMDAVLTSLLNEIVVISDDFWLVLDDYHVLQSPVINEAMTFLLDHLPPQMHLVIITREDPQLPLSRLRVRDQLTELRADQLRFTLHETSMFLNQVMNLTLATPDVKALEKRTEGWVAGLQLAALSLRERTDTQAFIQAFTGSHRFVVDYLLEEVLQHQSTDVREFLLRTSILDHLNGALCDAVTGQDNGQKTLEILERNNLFVVALDDARDWYRYHHLFGDALHSMLKSKQPDHIAVFHQRASNWYTKQNQLDEAIKHALLAENFEQAANLIELRWASMSESYQSDLWFEWASQLPEAIVLRHPVLCLGYGWVKFGDGDFETAEVWFQRAERWLDATPEAQQQMVISDQQQFEELPASLHHARGYLALTMGDPSAARQYAEQTLELNRHRHHVNYMQGMVMCGLAHLANGDLIQANQTLSDFIAYLETTSHISDATEMVFIIGDICITLGQLHAAHQAYENAFRFLDRHGRTAVIGLEDLHRGIADVYLVWHQLTLAEENILAAQEIGEQGITRPNWLSRLYTTQAQLKIAQGEVDAAIHLLDEAERQTTPLPILLKQPISAMRANVWIRQGKLDAAQRWAHQHRLSVQDDITYLQEYDYVVLARLQLALYRVQPSDQLRESIHDLLAKLHQTAYTGQRMSHVIDVLILKALMYAAQHEPNLAIDTLQDALKLAEPEGHVRPFIEAGQPMADLLRRTSKQPIMPDYSRRLLAFFDNTASPRPTEHPLIDPLSERELDVLRLLLTDLSGPEIARELFISLSTMRTHTRNIYSKLGVNNRRAAVRRATELKLL